MKTARTTTRSRPSSTATLCSAATYSCKIAFLGVVTDISESDPWACDQLPGNQPRSQQDLCHRTFCDSWQRQRRPSIPLYGQSPEQVLTESRQHHTPNERTVGQRECMAVGRTTTEFIRKSEGDPHCQPSSCSLRPEPGDCTLSRRFVTRSWSCSSAATDVREWQPVAYISKVMTPTNAYDALPVHDQSCYLTIADALSRAPASTPSTADKLLQQEITAYVDFVVIHLAASEQQLAVIRECQKSEQVCQHIVQFCPSGWPEKNAIPAEVKPYYTVAAELTVHEDLLLRGSRIVIPPPLCKTLLRKIHCGHQGITKCRSWPDNCGQGFQKS